MAKFSMENVVLFITMCIMSFINAVFSQQSDSITEMEMTMPTSTEASNKPGPNDLLTVDYIIIGFTCALVGGTVIGGIIFACNKSKQSNRAREDLYNEYLEKKQYAGIRAGHTNKGFAEEVARH